MDIGVLEITAIVTAVATVIGVAAAIFLRQALHRASDGGVVAPENKGTIETRRDTAVSDQGTSADHAQSVHVEHNYGLVGEDRDSLRRMEATMGDLRSEITTLVSAIPPRTFMKTEEADDPEAFRKLAGREFEKGEYEAGRRYSEQALAVSQADPATDLSLQLDILIDLSEAATDARNIWDSVRYFREAASLAEEMSERERGDAIQESRSNRRIAAYLRTSIAYQMRGLGRPAAAFRELTRASELAEGAGDISLEARISYGFGEYYREVGDDVRAVEHLERAADVFAQSDEPDRETSSLLSLGEVRANQDEGRFASEAYSRALESARSAGDQGLEAEALIGLAGLQSTEDGGTSAEGLLREALSLAMESGQSVLSIKSLIGLAEVDMRRKNLAKADEWLMEGLKLARNSEDSAGELLLVVRMTTIAVRMGDYERALSHLDRVGVLRKEVSGTDGLRVEEWMEQVREKMAKSIADD